MGDLSRIRALFARPIETLRDAGEDRQLPVTVTLLAAAIAATVLSPLAWLLLRALAVPPGKAVGLLTSQSTLEVLANTVFLVGAVTPAATALGTLLAVLTVRTDLPHARLWTIALALPLVIPSYIGAFAYASAFGPDGTLAQLLAPLGIESLPSIYGFEGAVLVLTLYIYPYVFLTTRAALLSLDTTLVEAARTLHHTPREAFRTVTLPQITPGIVAGALLVALYTLSDFGTPAIMHVDVFTRAIYVQYNAFARGSVALLSLQLLGVTAVILAIESQVKGGNRSMYVGSASSADRTVALGPWKWPALAICGAVVVLALAIPIGVLLSWLFTSSAGYGGTGSGFSWLYAWHSVKAAGVTALISVLAAVPVAYLSGRYDSRLATVLDRMTYVGYAVPGIVLGLSLVYLGVRYVPGLYQTLPLLIFAYVVRFLPQAVGSIRSSVQQVDSTLLEAARTLGHSRSTAFRTVTLPLIAPGVAAGGALVFLTTMRELPATLLLQPPEYRTLVSYIWYVRDAGFYGRAAVPTLLLVAVSTASMGVILARERYDRG
ncbi:MAG: ABC transporter permease [Halodesulfurarchaeum sp.]